MSLLLKGKFVDFHHMHSEMGLGFFLTQKGYFFLTERFTENKIELIFYST